MSFKRKPTVTLFLTAFLLWFNNADWGQCACYENINECHRTSKWLKRWPHIEISDVIFNWKKLVLLPNKDLIRLVYVFFNCPPSIIIREQIVVVLLILILSVYYLCNVSIKTVTCLLKCCKLKEYNTSESFKFVTIRRRDRCKCLIYER